MLRQYQIELIERSRDAYRRGRIAPCIVLPCGGGKSVIVADIAKNATLKGNRVLFLVHRKELCEQIERTFRTWGVDMKMCDVMMVQTATRRVGKIPVPQLIITDENHHSKAATYRRIYDAYPNAKRIGVTATPIRLDGSGLADVNDELVVGVSAKWLIANKFLAPYEYYAPTIADISGIKTVHGEFDAKTAERLLMKQKIHGDVIRHYQRLAYGRQAICYCVSVAHSQAVADAFCEVGIAAVHIDGETPKSVREDVIERFRSGEIKILCNVDLISEGFDVPDCSCAILLRPTKSLTLFIQQSMRCMRYKPEKSAIIIDHVGNYLRFGMPDAEREWSLEDKPKQSENEHQTKFILKCPECDCVFEAKFDGVLMCPDCGYIFEKKREAPQVKPQTELKKITNFRLDFSSPDDCKSYKELLEYAKKKGYKSGWAYYQAKRRGLI